METLARAANRGSIATGAGGYTIDYSLKLEADNSERMQRGTYPTLGTPTNAKIATISYWAKRTELISNNAHFGWIANAGANSSWVAFEQDKARVYTMGGNSLMSNAVFRDTSAFYHFVAAFDMTQSTASNRVKIYINGEQITSFQLETYGAQNNDIGIYDLNMSHYIGYSGGQGFNGYITEVYLIDGQQLLPTDFGEFDEDTGIWKPIEYQGTFGNQGYYINMSNSADLGEDSSGNGNDFGNLSNITSADQATDTPTNNFCTLNPLVTYYGSATINEGATKIQGTSTSSFETVYSTMAVTSGKWYFELVNLLDSTRNTSFGIVNLDTAEFDGTTYNSAGFWLGNMDTGGQLYYYENGVATGSEYITFSQGDIIGLAFDADNGTLDFYINNSNQEQFTGIPSGTFAFLVEVQGTGAPYIQTNFGGYTVIPISSAETDANGYGTFEYAPPSGYYALCSKNLAQYG